MGDHGKEYVKSAKQFLDLFGKFNGALKGQAKRDKYAKSTN